MKSSLLIWTVCALIVAACIVLVLYGCQTVTVQLGDYPSADRATGVRATTDINKAKQPPEEKK